MNFALKRSETVRDAVPRLGTGRVDLALHGLRDPGADRDQAVHSARKRLKETRAVLRLARGGLKRRVYQQDDAALRAAGRSLSSARDACVRIQTLDGLIGHYAGVFGPGAYQGTRERLLARYEAVAAGGIANDAIDALEEARRRTSAWSPQADGLLADGLERTYRRGREAFAAALDSPTTPHLHDWRKRVKDLWYQVRLVAPAWPAVLEPLADEAHRLADLLGDDHDLAMLHDEVVADPTLFDTPAARDTLADLLAQRRAALQDEALRLGRVLYAEQPKAFARRLDAVHAAWSTAGA